MENLALQTPEEALAGMKGAFVESLVRGSKRIKADRAIAIAKSAQMAYRRTIEDMQTELESTQMERSAALDMSPVSADSLELAKNFIAVDFVSKDLAYGLKIRELGIKLEDATQRYELLFGAFPKNV